LFNDNINNHNNITGTIFLKKLLVDKLVSNPLVKSLNVSILLYKKIINKPMEQKPNIEHTNCTNGIGIGWSIPNILRGGIRCVKEASLTSGGYDKIQLSSSPTDKYLPKIMRIKNITKLVAAPSPAVNLVMMSHLTGLVK
jgi:hypothetical protein